MRPASAIFGKLVPGRELGWVEVHEYRRCDCQPNPPLFRWRTGQIFPTLGVSAQCFAILDNPARGPPSGCAGCEKASPRRHPSTALRDSWPGSHRDGRKRKARADNRHVGRRSERGLRFPSRRSRPFLAGGPNLDIRISGWEIS